MDFQLRHPSGQEKTTAELLNEYFMPVYDPTAPLTVEGQMGRCGVWTTEQRFRENLKIDNYRQGNCYNSWYDGATRCGQCCFGRVILEEKYTKCGKPCGYREWKCQNCGNMYGDERSYDRRVRRDIEKWLPVWRKAERMKVRRKRRRERRREHRIAPRVALRKSQRQNAVETREVKVA